MREEILKELARMKRSLRKSERENIYPLINAIENSLDDRFSITTQTVLVMNNMLANIASQTDNVKTLKSIVKVLSMFLNNIDEFKPSTSLIPIKTQINLDRTMEALDMLLANLIGKLGGVN